MPLRIAEVAFPVPLHKTFHYLVPAGLDPKPGARVRASFGPRRLVGTVLSVGEGEPQRALKPIDAVLDAEPPLTPELLDCARWLARRYSAPIGECLRAVLPASVRPKGRDKPIPALGERRPRTAFSLTEGQARAVDSLKARLAARKFHVSLLYGVPASGKTEVYLRLIEEAVKEGGQCLFLLPEISLTLPFFQEFAAGLSARVGLWHSNLLDSERRAAWMGLRRGEVKVVVGARSACLLPFQDLRLVVIDEEQDESFKQEGQSPLYHAREVALERARSFGALAVLGSATPSLEAWERAERGEYELTAMPQRVSSAPRPSVRVVPCPFPPACLSDGLVDALRERLGRREQSILLVNRRGFSTLVMCYKCGWVDRCPDCGVAKISHEAGEGFLLVCHHCSRKTPLPAACPSCKNPQLRIAGTGTQKVVSEVRARLRGARVLRMDRDSLEGAEARRIYEGFRDHEADILVGTKLVAKSFHFPEVTLVGVVDADTMIHMPDFRASERTAQLLAQVAGRSGRADKPGEVIIQTLHPDHGGIQAAARSDFTAFARGELQFRRELRYPPYAALVRLVWQARSEEAARRAAEESLDALRLLLPAERADLLGPTATIPPKAQGQFRFHALMKVLQPERLEEACGQARGLPLPSGAKLKINVDPYDLM